VSHPLVERLRRGDAAERRAACQAAPADPAATLLVDALCEALGDADRRVARAASAALARIARESGGAGDALREALRGDDRDRRIFAALTWAELEPPGHRILPALIDGLRHPEGDVRWAAARLLVTAGRLHSEVLGVLLGLLGGAETPTARRMAAYCVRELAPDVPEAARALVAASRDDDVHVRRASLTAMAALVDPPPPVRARLAEARGDDPDEVARRLAGRALELLASEPGGAPA